MFVELAVGLKPMTCALRVQLSLFPDVTCRHLPRIFRGFSRGPEGPFHLPSPPSTGTLLSSDAHGEHRVLWLRKPVHHHPRPHSIGGRNAFASRIAPSSAYIARLSCSASPAPSRALYLSNLISSLRRLATGILAPPCSNVNLTLIVISSRLLGE